MYIILYIKSILWIVYMAELKILLSELNPWWRTKFEPLFRDRELYQQIQKFIPLRQILAFIGLRRVGKTSILLKILTNVLTYLEPAHVLYFTFDNNKEVSIRELVAAYEQLHNLDVTNGKYFLFLDEIQKLDDWEDQLKLLYDMRPNIKIILSGSESLFIKNKSKESLAGRIYQFRVEPLTFREYLDFKDIQFLPIALYEKELLREFHQFIKTLGFPEMVNETDNDIIKKYITEGIIDTIIYKDIPTTYSIHDTQSIRKILTILMEEPGQIIDISELAKDLKLSRHTVSFYLTILEESFLVQKLYNYSRNQRKINRKLKKYYPAVISSRLLLNENILLQSKVFEWLLINQLHSEYFWRDPQQNEVDTVVTEPIVLPIEVKYGKIETHGIRKFMKKFGVDHGIIVSYNTEEILDFDGKKITVVPAYKFLLEKEKYLKL